MSPREHVNLAVDRATSMRQLITRLDPVRDAALIAEAYRLLDEFDTTAQRFDATKIAQAVWHLPRRSRQSL